MLKDLKFALRSLLTQPVFAVVAILTLGLGIGATTAVFSILNAVLIEELPYNEPDRLYALRSMADNGTPTGMMADRFARPFYEGHPSVDAAAIGFALAGSIIADDGTAYPFLPYRFTSRFFDVFSNSIVLGRGFEPSEPDDSVVISYAAWGDYFGSDPGILGRIVTIDNSPRQVIGVGREGFEFPEGAQSWSPLDLGPALQDIINFDAYLRMRPGVAAETLETELVALSAELGPNTETGQPLTYALIPLLDDVVGDLGPTVLILTGATAILLLIACLNVANLLFVRATARSHEIGLREALGAGRLRIIRQLLTESLALSALGGILGVGLAFIGLRVLLGIGPSDLPRLDEVTLDARVLLFSVGVVAGTSILVGLAPALRLSRSRLRALIDRGGRGGSLGLAEKRVFSILVVAEVSLAVVLVVGAGMLLRSYSNLAGTDFGFDPDRTLTVRLNATHVPLDFSANVTPDGTVEYSGNGYQPVTDFYDNLSNRILGLPGVVGVAHGQELPLQPNVTQASTEPLRIASNPDEEYQVRIRTVSPEFFDLLETPMVAGRGIEPTDRRGAPGVGVVNEAFVERFFPTEDPIGRRILLPSADFRIPRRVDEQAGRGLGFAERIYDSVEIVGVVADVRFLDRRTPPPPHLFMATAQFTTRMRNLAVKTEFDDPQSLVASIRREIADMAPTLPVEFDVYSQVVDRTIARQRLGTVLLGVFASIALVLSAVGIYGVMASTVTERTRELAVRSALGASAGQVLGSVVLGGLTLGVIGVGIGAGMAVVFRETLASEVFGVGTLDPAVLVLVAALLLLVTGAASFVPALRASRIDAMIALREE